MEDKHSIRFVRNNEGGFEFAYFGIFDGHGGGEASKFARDHLLNEITKFDCFWSDDDDDILFAIKSGFLDCHYGMWKQVEKWPKTSSGFLSTSGTTASICIIKNSKLYIGHVGDSGIVLGFDDSKNDKLIVPKAKMLTTDHKPDSPKEKKRIEESGGQVVAKSGVQRVVWNRPRMNHKGPIRRSTTIDKIPFLAVARSLGDLWSYNYAKEEFVVSPEPDVMVHKLDPKRDKCLVIGSDGLWNMMSAEECVNTVVDLEYQFEYKVINDPSVPVSYWINPAERLVQMALNKWRMKLMKADNTSCIVVLIDPLGPRKLSILKKQRDIVMKKMEEVKSSTIPKSPSVDETASVAKKEDQLKAGHKTSPVKNVPVIPTAPVVGKGQFLWKDSTSGFSVDHSVLGSVVPEPSPMHKFTDNLDDSIQVRNLVPPVAPVTPSKKTSPLQQKSDNVSGRPGRATRSSPQKLSPGTKTRSGSVEKDLVSIKTKKEEVKRMSGVHLRHTSGESAKTSPNHNSAEKKQKCLQPCKHSTENVRNSTCKNVPNLKDMENLFSSSDVKLSLKNLNITKGKQKVKGVKNLNNSNLSESKASRKQGNTGKSLSSRISLRLRRIRQKSMRSKTQTENKGIVPKVGGVKRKLDTASGSPVVKKCKHS